MAIARGDNVAEAKRRLREEVWERMERLGVARFPLPCRGRVPNFEGAERAAALLRGLEEYRRAKTVLVNPDSPQRPVRRQALLDGKTVVMATPGLTAGFILLRPERLRGLEGEASTIRGAFRHGETTRELPEVGLVVEGSVAVDPRGNRLGKGGGYGDREIRMARERSGGGVRVVTTVHSAQVVPSVPIGEGDERVDLIVTERGVHRTPTGHAEGARTGWAMANA